MTIIVRLYLRVGFYAAKAIREGGFFRKWMFGKLLSTLSTDGRSGQGGLGAFYSCPIFYTLNGEVISLYVGISEGEFILPNKPQMSFMNDGKEVQCDKALIAIPEVFPDEKISKIDYQTFVDRIPKGGGIVNQKC